MPVTINGTTGIAGVDGSASVPSVQGSDTNTGEFFPAADTIAWTTGGSERMRIASTGNVGIGGSPSADTTYKWLNIIGPSTSGGGIVQLNNSDSSVGINMFCNNLAGYVGTSTAHPLLFRINSSEVARFDTLNNLLVGTTSNLWSNSMRMAVAGNQGAAFIATGGASAAAIGSWNQATSGTRTQISFADGAAGTIQGSITTNGSSVSYNTTSDYRLKENVQPMTTGLATISALKPVTYDWISSKSHGEGFIAHELQTVIPAAVTGEKDEVDEDGNPINQGVDYSKIVVHLVAAVKELSAKVDAQAAEIAALKANAPA